MTPSKLMLINCVDLLVKRSRILPTNWIDLCGKKIPNRIVLIAGYNDSDNFPLMSNYVRSNPKHNSQESLNYSYDQFLKQYQQPVFQGATTVFFDKNDENFIFHVVNRRFFPNNPTIYLNSHPASDSVLKSGLNIRLVDRFYYQYGKRWTNNDSKVSNITYDSYKDLLHILFPNYKQD